MPCVGRQAFAILVDDVPICHQAHRFVKVVPNNESYIGIARQATKLLLVYVDSDGLAEIKICFSNEKFKFLEQILENDIIPLVLRKGQGPLMHILQYEIYKISLEKLQMF